MIRRTIPVDLWMKNPAAALDAELARERASALGRLGRALESAVQALGEFDATHPPPRPPLSEDATRRSALVADAGHKLWQLIVQREACGLRDSRAVLQDYRVPAEVQRTMGAMHGRPRSR